MIFEYKGAQLIMKINILLEHLGADITEYNPPYDLFMDYFLGLTKIAGPLPYELIFRLAPQDTNDKSYTDGRAKKINNEEGERRKYNYEADNFTPFIFAILEFMPRGWTQDQKIFNGGAELTLPFDLLNFIVGPNYVSQDGEYRSYLFDKKSFNELCAANINKIKITDYLEIMGLKFDIFTSYPKTGPDYDDIIARANDDAPMLLAHSMFIVWHMRNFAYSLNPDFMKLFDVFRQDKMIIKTDLPLRDSKFGVKFIPITIYEAMNYHDVKMELWREIYINRLTERLVFNSVCRNFTSLGIYSLVRDCGVTLFDNKAMHIKYDNSMIAKKMVDHLVSANKFAYFENTLDEGPRNDDFAKFSENIKDTVEIINEKMELTDCAGKLYFMNCGFSWGSINPIKNKNNVGPNKINFDFDSNEKFYTVMRAESLHKIMMDNIYALYCLHTRLFIIHTDLHPGNFTVEILTEPRHTIYYFSDDEIYHMHNEINSYIIDFSRAIISPSAPYSAVVNDVFLNAQLSRAIYTCGKYFPDFFNTYSKELNDLAENNFELYFKIISGSDIFSLANSYNIIFNRVNVRDFVPPEIIKTVNNISERASEIILDYLRRAINKEVTKTNEIEWCSYLIMREFLGNYCCNLATIIPRIKGNAVIINNYSGPINKIPEELISLGRDARFGKLENMFNTNRNSYRKMVKKYKKNVINEILK